MFNPFDKPINQLNEEDLKTLMSVSEGWYIEYKKEMPNSKNIAKSVASFANSYGGLLFIGIEADKQTNRCKNIIGIKDNVDKIRDSVKGNIKPFPYFNTHIIELSNSNNVVIVNVMEGKEAPYIHSDGKVYRRQEAASDPVPENDRYTIDKMYQKSNEFNTLKDNFRKVDYLFSKSESEIPILCIYLLTNPFRSFSFDNFYQLSFHNELLTHFNKTMSIKDYVDGHEMSFKDCIKFDTISSYYNSVVLRSLHENSLCFNNLTIEIDFFGNFKAYIPIQHMQPYDENLDYFLKCSLDDLHYIRFIDTKTIFGSVFGLIYSYVTYLNSKGFKNEIESSFHIRHAFRTSLKINTRGFNQYLFKYGIPICFKDKQDFPEIPIVRGIKEIIEHPMIEIGNCFQIICSALGLPAEIAILETLNELRSAPKLFL